MYYLDGFDQIWGSQAPAAKRRYILDQIATYQRRIDESRWFKLGDLQHMYQMKEIWENALVEVTRRQMGIEDADDRTS